MKYFIFPQARKYRFDLCAIHIAKSRGDVRVKDGGKRGRSSRWLMRESGTLREITSRKRKSQFADDASYFVPVFRPRISHSHRGKNEMTSATTATCFCEHASETFTRMHRRMRKGEPFSGVPPRSLIHN